MMKLGICIYTNDPESVWNAFRFGNYAAKHSIDEVQVFLLGKGFETESLSTDKFNMTEQIELFVAGGGQNHGLRHVSQTPPVRGVGPFLRTRGLRLGILSSLRNTRCIAGAAA